MEQGEKVAPVGSTPVLHICTIIYPLLKYKVALIGSTPMLCLCVNLLPAKYYIAPVGSAVVLHIYTNFVLCVILCNPLTLCLHTGLGSNAKMQCL
jgi:hypothetical protein